ncbi:hypothetical protein RostovM3_00043 [Vibrio phage Rostov M3]|uniref:Uncharacterized protein n=1 Tax=Vibrio phage Rostov M3 TaxID=2660724 RepID=A0A5Q2W914_9CAUD|nr:hypothetical protein RostovM3_00043 [Vibrio phage Rostov M3]
MLHAFLRLRQYENTPQCELRGIMLLTGESNHAHVIHDITHAHRWEIAITITFIHFNDNAA